MSGHVFRDGQFEPGHAGGGDVLEMKGCVIACAGADFFRVTDEERCGEASLKGFYFVLTVWCVGDGGPFGAVAVPASCFSQWTNGEAACFPVVVLGCFRRSSIVG